MSSHKEPDFNGDLKLFKYKNPKVKFEFMAVNLTNKLQLTIRLGDHKVAPVK